MAKAPLLNGRKVSTIYHSDHDHVQNQQEEVDESLRGNKLIIFVIENNMNLQPFSRIHAILDSPLNTEAKGQYNVNGSMVGLT